MSLESPKFEPEVAAPEVPEKEKDPLSYLPAESRTKILKTLQKDLLVRGKHMDEKQRMKTLETVIDFEETDAEQIHGQLVTSDNLHAVHIAPGLEKASNRPISQAMKDVNWQDTELLHGEAANESDIEEKLTA